MKKCLIGLLLVVMLGAGALGFTACTDEVVQGPQGIQGEQGPQGEKGDTGAKGDKGEKGEDGVDGQDGLTPYIGENGNWWIGDVDTGIGATGDKGDQGETGEQGPQGNGGLSAFEIFKKYNPEYTGTEQDWIYAVTTNNVCALYGHKEVIDEALVATCTTDGLTQGSHCEVCEKVLVKQELIAAGHNYIDNICSICGFNCDTNGLILALSEDGESYSVSGYNGLDTEIIIPSAYNGKPITSIGDYAFKDCDALISIKLSNQVTNIGYCSFQSCINLVRIEIGSALMHIESQALQYCIRLKNIEVVEENIYYKSINGDLYSKDGKTLIQYALGKIETTFEVPNSVMIIGEMAFMYCPNLVKVKLSDNVTKIGHSAFAYCDKLESIEFSNSVTYIGSCAFINSYNITTINFKGTEVDWATISKGMFWDTNIVNYTINYIGSDI